MKTQSLKIGILLGMAVILIGCAEARLGVHVDLFRFDEVNQAGLSLEQRVRLLEKILTQSEGDVQALFTEYRQGNDKLLQARLQSAGDDRGLIKQANKVHDHLADVAISFERLLQGHFDKTRKLLQGAREMAIKAQQASGPEPRHRTTGEALLESARQELAEAAKELQQEFSAPMPGETRKRQLSLQLTKNERDTLLASATTTSQGAESLKQAETSIRAAESLGIRAADEAEKAGDSSIAVRQLTNPDLAQNDGDPFYATLSDPKYAPHWSTNFFIQNIKSDGKVSFLIVRETPVRFSVNEAKTDPSILIKTQLRGARAGIKVVADVAKALNPALPLPNFGGSSSGTGTKQDNMKLGTARSVTPAEEESQRQLLLLEQKLNQFNEELSKVRTAYDQARKQVEFATNKVMQLTTELTMAKTDKESAAKQEMEAEKEHEQKAEALKTAEAELKAVLDDATAQQTKKDGAMNKKTAAMEAGTAAKTKWNKAKSVASQAAEKAGLLENELKAAKDKATEAQSALERVPEPNGWANKEFTEKIKPALTAFQKNLDALVPPK